MKGTVVDEPGGLPTNKTLDAQSIEIISKGLRDFGYDIDVDHVTIYVNRMLNGEKPKSGPEMFIQGWLQKAGLLT